MKLLSVSEIPVNSKVILRMDLDVPMDDGVVTDNSRLKKSVLTIKLLLERECKIIIIGHRGRPTTAGRPDGRDMKLSLRPVYAELMSLLEQKGHDVVKSVFVDNVDDREKIAELIETNGIIFGENLRFWPGERKNDDSFLGVIKEVSQYFVNDAFGVAHRKEASVMLGGKMSTFYGLAFVDEVEKLEKIKEEPERPVVVILAGSKKDKLGYLKGLEKLVDKVLVGGELPKLVESRKLESEKVIWAKLNESGEDISRESVEKFKQILAEAKTVVWAGALGKYEVEEGMVATREIARFLAGREVVWVVAGGDTAASLKNLGVKDKIDLMASGGGVVLEYLTKGELPAWEN